MRLTQTRTYMTMLFTLLFSLVAQPVLAVSISVTMQYSSPYHQDMMAMQGTDCQHMMLSHNQETQPEQEISQGCRVDCQFCMHITFILPLVQPELPGRHADVMPAGTVQKQFSTPYLPAHEPPRPSA